MEEVRESDNGEKDTRVVVRKEEMLTEVRIVVIKDRGQ